MLHRNLTKRTAECEVYQDSLSRLQEFNESTALDLDRFQCIEILRNLTAVSCFNQSYDSNSFIYTRNGSEDIYLFHSINKIRSFSSKFGISSTFLLSYIAFIHCFTSLVFGFFIFAINSRFKNFGNIPNTLISKGKGSPRHKSKLSSLLFWAFFRAFNNLSTQSRFLPRRIK